MKIFEHLYDRQYVSLTTIIYFSLHYFYLGKAFKNIKTFELINNIYRDFDLLESYDLECNNKDSVILYNNIFSVSRFALDELRYTMMDSMPIKTYKINDMNTYIAKFAIKYEKELYWN